MTFIGLLTHFSASERAARAARKRWLPEGRRGPMPWIIAIMMFLTILAAALGLALGHGLVQMHQQLAGGYTIQLVEADATKRDAQLRTISALLDKQDNVLAFSIVPQEKLRAQLEPWIGGERASEALPIPALIDVEMQPDTSAGAIRSIAKTVRTLVPSAHMDAHARYLEPVETMMRWMIWLAVGLVLLMVIVTSAVVMLAMRSAHNTHRPTIDIMHLLGATDVQIARMFQERMALDAIFGGFMGLAAAAVMLWLLGRGFSSMESGFTHMMAIPWGWWIILVLIPVLGVVLAVLTARITVRRALESNL